MSTSSSTNATFEFNGNKRTRKTTTINYRKILGESEWVEDSKTVLIEEWDEPFYQPTVPQQAVPPFQVPVIEPIPPAYPPFAPLQPQIWSSAEPLQATTASAIPDPPKSPHQPYA